MYLGMYVYIYGYAHLYIQLANVPKLVQKSSLEIGSLGGQLALWLNGQLVGWLVGLSVGLMARSLIGWLFR